MSKKTFVGREVKLSRVFASGLALVLFLVSVFAAAPSFAIVTFRSAAQAATASGGGAIAHAGAGNSARRNNCGSITPTVPAGSAGDMLVALVNARENGATVTMPGWTQYFTDTYPGQEFKVFIFWRLATGGDPSTVTQSGTCSSIGARISRFSGVNTASPFETNPITGGQWVRQNSGNLDTGTDTTTGSTRLPRLPAGCPG